MKTIEIMIISVTAILVAAAPLQAQPTLTCSFYNITNNNPVNAAIGEIQLSVDITGVNNDIARFTFANAGPADSVIAQIYFEDTDGLMNFNSFDTFESGVYFEQITGSLNLPGGNQSFVNFTESYGFAAKPPAPRNGIGPGESLAILFDLETADCNELISSIEQGQLRIGIQTVDFPDGNSESFITYPPGNGVLIPAPASFGLCLIGSASALLLRRKNKG